MLKPDDTLLDGRYVIVRKIAKGGMGIVYLAHDTRLGREVAMKVLPPEVADDRRAIRDLKQEAETAAKLQHENIVAVYDFGQSDELYFITMEYVDGQTLSDLVYFNHPLPIAQVIDIMLQICAGLQYMHERQVLHRDIKPHNIMIKPGGTVKITDFGIAHLVKQTVTRHTGTTSGTVAYAAPELFTGQQSDARTDIYSLGVSLFEIVTNDLPFNGMDITYMHREVPAPSPMTRYPQLNIHPQIDAIVLKCMQKRPDDRFGSMVELRELLLTLQRQLGDRERLPDLLREAQTEQRAGNAQAAAQRFQYILGVDPGNVEAQQGLRQAQEQLDRQRAVAELFQQAQDAAAGGDYQRAIELSQQVLAIDPGNAAAQAGITAAEQARADRYARIQSLFREAQEAVEARNYQRAIELSQQVLAIDPGNAAAQAGVAAAQRSLREQQAEREALISQATAAHDSGNYRDAIQLWNRVLDTAPDHPRARAGLARSEQALQQQQQQEVERLLAQARDEQQAGNLDASVQLLERAVRIDRAHAAAQAALKAVRKALNTRSKELARLADQARRQEDDGDLKDAIATWQRVLQLDPAHQDARTSIKADQDILDAEQRRKDQELRKLVAQAQAEEQRKEYATAIQTWQRALQL
ncbi:MAG TPA: protein kinase, partial [Roseiflexaceae bacterium]|nr:protein kinase [Roseiflexaceae bacterium]